MLIPSNEKVSSALFAIAAIVIWVSAPRNLVCTQKPGSWKKEAAIQEQSRPPQPVHMENVLDGVLAGSEAVSVAEDVRCAPAEQSSFLALLTQLLTRASAFVSSF